MIQYTLYQIDQTTLVETLTDTSAFIINGTSVTAYTTNY
jgi:hypothetical protein